MDVLSRLAARALGVASAIRPVVAPLVLPEPMLLNQEMEQGARETWMAAAGQPSSVQAARPDHADVAPGPDRSRGARAGTPLTDSVPVDDVPREPPSDGRPTAVSVAIAPPPSAERPVSTVRRQRETAPPRSDAGRDVTRAASGPKEVAIPPAANESAARGLADRDARADATFSRDVGVRLPRSMTPAPHPLREVTAQPADATGYRAALAAIRQSVAPVTMTEHEPTVVRVTIGRIDVRSTPPPIEQPPAPAPSLDNRLADYLTRRTGDRR